MMKKIVLILSMLVLPVTLLGQSTLNFPRAYAPADLTATGFAVVNPGPTDATVTFRLLSASGATVASSSQPVRGRGQLARLGSEYFPNAAAAGWVQVTSATTGLQGFWIGGDFSTFTDGADGSIAATDQILPLVAGQTEINIANPGASAITVTIRLRGANGTESATAVTRDIPALGIFQSQVLAIFPSANLGQPTHIRITSPGAFVATSVVTGLLAPRDTGVLNGVDATSATLEMNFPHVVSGALGGQNYSTVVGVTNLASTAQTVTIVFRQDPGPPSSVQRTLPANGTLRETVQSLFNFSNFQNGWIKVTGTSAITGYVAYAETTAGGFAVVPVQVTPRTNLLFLQVADLFPWSTGISLLNATTTAANVEVFAMYPDPDRGLIGGPATTATASFTLNPGVKMANLLPELVGMSVNGGFVFVRTTNNVPLYGLELFFDRSGSFLANVTAGSLAPGISFTPPGVSVPSNGPVLSAISAARTTRNTILTLTGSNFSTIAGNNLVVFKTATGTVEVAASTATTTSLTVVIPSTAISGPVSVKVNGQATTAGLVVEITASATALDQNSVRVSDGQASSGMDIYVPPPVGPLLNATQASANYVGATNFVFTSSADLLRGQTKDLAVSGTGMTQANGSGISFSGEGLTVSNVHFQTSGAATLIIVTIAVDANAEVGPRNIGIKNSNLDQTILAGGVFVR
jgi:hypothetical protein